MPFSASHRFALSSSDCISRAVKQFICAPKQTVVVFSRTYILYTRSMYILVRGRAIVCADVLILNLDPFGNFLCLFDW